MAEEIRPKEKLTPLQWGERKRVYTKEGKESRWRVEATPWARRILWALSDESPYKRIVAPKGTQLGFTEIGLIRIGQGCEAGQSALVIMPTETVAKRTVKGKFRPMIQTTPALRALFPGRSADTGLHFSSPSCDVMFAGSNSPSSFASMTVPFVLGDEIDRWSQELLKEGDPLPLLENRIAEYGFLGKLFLPCSPTLTTAPVWREWLVSNQEVFKTPCPRCGVLQQWLWDNMVWEGQGTRQADYRTASLRCIECGEASDEYAWKSIWNDGEWHETCPEPVRQDTIGFHLSTLYARLGQRDWADLAQVYDAADADGRASAMQPFFNGVLGLPWAISEESLPADALRVRLDPSLLDGVCPEDCLLLTAGVDYQKTWVEVWVWGWTRAMRRWPIAKVVIERRTKDGILRSAADIAADLNREALEKDWAHAKGGSLRVEMALHDSGDHPALVFDVLEHLSSAKNLASKGLEGWNEKQPCRPPKVVDVKQSGKVVAHGRRLIHVFTASQKLEWYEDLRRTEADAEGERFVHLPAWLDAVRDDGLLDGLVAEEVRKTTRGKLQWVKLIERNEPLDCAILARCAHWQLKAHRWNEDEWRLREEMVAQVQKPEPPPTDGGGSPPPAGGTWINTGGKRWIS